ncbi:GHMP family kinase ATP-binding protein [Acetobacterium woodii]|uniref:Putative kinase n=1 Tax=Acetobacterium woodii (strain ATCC 29683 / DSM 1030 / JCM 2381 / KCTC 1655 / WB1) TaxID=931626 RepID=H6LI79_ACEWD|nr:GHMP kinase [Acetobacterium woodii]AFA49779.1 putative kinase [Acetobacterium woodii DSM 1030]
MRRVKVETPGTCGEFIQGWYEGSPCLVSSPIDRYSRIIIEEGRGNLATLRPKTVKQVEAIFQKYQLSQKEKEHLHFTMSSDIPLEKGMASSTADIAGMAAGLSAYFGLELTAAEIGRLCTGIEPSDNLMFEKLNLFNHIDGSVLKEFNGTVEADLMIIDFKGGIDTMSFNETQDDYGPEDLESFAEIIIQFENGVQSNNLQAIGEACTKSAFLNQKRLNKNYLECLHHLSRDFGGLGTIIGHSGTVIGIMYNEGVFQEEAFRKALKRAVPESSYTDIYKNHLISGGIKITIDEV